MVTSSTCRHGPIASLDISTQRRATTGRTGCIHDQVVHTTYDAYWQVRDNDFRSYARRKGRDDGGRRLVRRGRPFRTGEGFSRYRRAEPGIARRTSLVIEGPWVHGGWSRGDGAHVGRCRRSAPTRAKYLRASTLNFPFFESVSSRDKTEEPLPKALVYLRNRQQCVWKKLPDSWPPKGAAIAETIYFGDRMAS